MNMTNFKYLFFLVLLSIVLLFLLNNCGPVQSAAHIVDAEVELKAAKAADANKYAVYEFVTSEEYLDKAREEQSHADYEAAIGYGVKALIKNILRHIFGKIDLFWLNVSIPS